MPHLPFHRFIGPGTDLTAQDEPVDRDDEIARHHDEAYAAAETSNEVREADREAIFDFLSDAGTTGNLHSLGGAIGLGGKYAVETFTGERPLNYFLCIAGSVSQQFN